MQVFSVIKADHDMWSAFFTSGLLSHGELFTRGLSPLLPRATETVARGKRGESNPPQVIETVLLFQSLEGEQATAKQSRHA